MRKVIMVLAVLALGMVSCVKDIEFEGEQSDPMLVVNGVQQVGQPARLCIEKSVFFQDNQTDCRVQGLQVDLYVDGSFKESLQVRDSMALDYKFNFCEGQYVLCEGDLLRFEVRSSEFETAIAEVTLPEPPLVISFDTVGIDYEFGSVRLAVTIDDPIGADYYNLAFYNPMEAQYSFYSDDPVFLDPMDLDPEALTGQSSDYYGVGIYNVFTDYFFSGRTYTVNFSFYFWGEEITEPLAVEVSRVDEHLYQYKKTFDAYQDSDPNSLLSMFTEPVQVYSNVENAVGVVCGQSRSVTKSIDLTNK